LRLFSPSRVEITAAEETEEKKQNQNCNRRTSRPPSLLAALSKSEGAMTATIEAAGSCGMEEKKRWDEERKERWKSSRKAKKV